MGRSKVLKVLMILVILSAALQGAIGPVNAHPVGGHKDILILHAQDQFLPANIVMDRNIYSVMKPAPGVDIAIYSEYLEKVRFNSQDTQNEIVKLLHRKYDAMSLDLIIITDDLSWDFMAEQSGRLFEGIPIVLCGITEGKLNADALPDNVTGNFKSVDIRANIDMILKIQPEINEVDVVIGTSRQDALYEAMTRKALEAYSKRLKVNYLIGLSLVETQDRISKLPADAVVLYISMYSDGAGNGFNPRDVVPLLRKTANVPIYGPSETYIGFGILGGHQLSFEDLSRNAAATALEILNGRSPASIPAVTIENRNNFDWNEMERWGITEADLPKGSFIYNRVPSPWDLYRGQIIGTLVFLIFEMLLIIFLMRQLALKKKAEQSLTIAKEKAEAANISKTQFLANMSHEIRTPINGVMGTLQLLRMTEQTEEQALYVTTALNSSNALMVVINDILDYARVEAGKIELVEKCFSLRQALEEVENYFKLTIQSKNLMWKTTIAEDVPSEVCGDPFRIRQILINLIGNAVKFTSMGAISIGVELAEAPGHGRVRIRFYIRDTGIGIDAEHIDGMFERFTQLDESNTRRYGGTGLGLPISKGLVELMQGEIGVTSQEGGGTEFHFTIPFKLAAVPADEANETVV